jgi:hypothetical protein
MKYQLKNPQTWTARQQADGSWSLFSSDGFRDQLQSSYDIPDAEFLARFEEISLEPKEQSEPGVGSPSHRVWVIEQVWEVSCSICMREKSIYGSRNQESAVHQATLAGWVCRYKPVSETTAGDLERATRHWLWNTVCPDCKDKYCA